MVDVQKIDRRCADMSPGFCIQREAAVAGAQGKSHIAAGKVDEVAVSAKFDRLDLIIICDARDRCEGAAERKNDVEGQRWDVRVSNGGGRMMKNKKTTSRNT